MRRLLMSAVALVALGQSPVHAILLVEYDLEGRTDPDAPVLPLPVAAGVTASELLRGPGLIAEDGDNSINSRGFTDSTVLDLASDDYYEFVIDASGDDSIAFDVLSFTARRSEQGPLAYAVVADVFGDGEDPLVLFEQSLEDNDDNFRLNLALGGYPSLQGASAPVTFRIYAFASQSPLGTFRIGIDDSSPNSDLPPNLQVFGDINAVAPIPEPSTVLMGVVGAVMLAGYGWRRNS